MAMSKYTIAVLVIWFGKLPPYFPVWLASAEQNADVDFFFLSDQEVVIKSSNVHVVKTTLQQEVKRISEKTGETIDVHSPYKFCDLRPFFGIAYQDDYLKDYDFWGYCDIDLAFGDIRKFLTDEVLEKHERLYEWGHFSLIRNNEKMNRMYYLPGSLYSLDETLRKPVKVTAEEHHGLNRICAKNDIKWYRAVDFADFWTCYSDLILWHDQKNYDHQVFYWENGHVFRAYIGADGAVQTDEYVYIHWQKRIPVPDDNYIMGDPCFILSNQIIVKDPDVPGKDQIFKLGQKKSEWIRAKERYLYICKKLISFVKMPMEGKKLWMRQKRDYYHETGNITQH